MAAYRSTATKWKSYFAISSVCILLLYFKSPFVDKGIVPSIIVGLFCGFILYIFLGHLVGYFFQKEEDNKKQRKYEEQEETNRRKSHEEQEKYHQLAIRREREMLQARADVQISTMERLHAQNVNVERQLMELRKELQTIENEENRAFMEEMIKQAERSLKG
jgi:uncharacterized membrane protein YhiD involved in acid resistance